ncbi:TonB-dependent receptor [Dinghuibacter silviterrae]|nr:TonB-dependent receptor [Dinghuibacter silviterrae]
MMTKLTSVLLVTACLQVSAKGFSQKVTLSETDVSLKKVFKEIHRQTGFLFFYSDELLQPSRKVSIHLRGAPLEEVLDSCFRDQPLVYAIVDNTIVVKGAPPPGLTLPVDQVVVRGRVTDAKGNPLIGVSVTVVGTTRGVATDDKGEFSIQVDATASLHFSYIGYEPVDVAVKGRSTLAVTLRLSTAELTDVVVVGYGTQQKTSVTGAVDQITSKDLDGKPAVNTMQLLQGVSPNLIIQTPDPSPGASQNFNIRGVGTFGDNTPLVVIDGIAGGNINLLNPSDIESMSVLKDAGAAAIYGSRSANGVLLITTKKGHKGQKPTVTYDGMWGIQKPRILISPLPAWENAIYKNESLTNVDLPAQYTPEQIQALKAGGDHEWFLKQILHPAPQQSHSVTLTGGGDNSTYLLSVGGVDQSSNFVGPNYGYTRYNVRVAATSQYGILKAGGTLSYSRDELKQNSFGNGFLMADAERTPTNFSMQDSLGRYLTNTVLTQFNPLGILQAGGYNLINNDDVFGNLNAELTLFRGFSIKGVFGGDVLSNHNFLRVKQVDFYPQGVYGNDRTTGDYWGQTIFTNIQLLAQYNRTFGEHHIGALVGASNESTTAKSSQIYYTLTDSALGVPTTGSIISTNATTSNIGATNTSLNSVFGRANYDYKGRYLAEFDFRADGSSKFRQGLRWGFFPSISAGWKLTDEAFMEHIRQRFGDLKLRGSYGVLGNQSVGNYQYETVYTSNPAWYGFNNTPVAGESFTFSNPNLTWERAATLNGGVDAYLLAHRLQVSLDYFNKLTTHILVVPAVPGTFGTTLPYYNAGKMRDQGWEASVKYTIPGRLFTHSFAFNLADNHNEVIYFQGYQQLNTDAEIQTVVRAGVPFNAYVGYKRDGYFQTPEDVAKYPKLVGITPIPGDIKYKDRNGDGVIDQNDYYVLGNPFPRFTFGFTYNVTVKNFDLSIFIQGVGKRTLFVRGELTDPFQGNYSYNIFKHQLNFWTPTNPNAAFPILSANGSQAQANDYNVGSDLYLYNGAYARLKNVQLGYTLPGVIAHKIRVQKLRVYFTGQNLYTLSKVKFIDPESTEFNSNLNNPGAFGNNQSGRVYPTPIFYGGGLDVTF